VELFGFAVAVGTLAVPGRGPRTSWRRPVPESASIGALGAVVLKNLPAAVLFSARSPAHPRALLIGLNRGPNVAVTGSLSALLWF